MSKEEGGRALAEDARRRLETVGRTVESVERLGNNTGYQIRCKGGGIVNVYDNGTINPQGKGVPALREILSLDSPADQKPPISRKIFVVYGHDNNARTQLEAMLLRWRLEPVILDQLPSEGQTLIEKLEKYTAGDIPFAVVLATPDDEGNSRGRPDECKFRARQNVILELGLLLNKLGRARVGMFLKEQEKMERPSDIQGLIYLPFVDNVEESKLLLAKEMQKQGLQIPMEKL